MGALDPMVDGALLLTGYYSATLAGFLVRMAAW